MTTRPAAEPGRARRAVVAGLTMLVLLLVARYAAVASVAVAGMVAVEPGALLAAPATEAAGRLDALTTPMVRTALAAMPLDQRVANVAMIRETRREGATRTVAWLPVVSRLGWRDTPSLQNLLYVAARTRDLPRILDVSDALLRRQKLMDQIIPALALLEPQPVLRQALAARLVARPSWRGTYLATTAQLRDRPQLLARYALLRRLQQGGLPLDRGETVPNINALDHAGLPAYGFALWQRTQPHVVRPLDDPRFVRASRNYQADHDPVPYQWQMMTGEGFSADATNDGGHTALVIDWDGRGVPVFAQQRTSASPSRYALVVKTPTEDAADLSAIAFRLVCDGAATPFRPAGSGRYVTDGVVPCSYPILQIAGDVQPSAVAHQLSVYEISLAPVTSLGF